MKARRNGRKGVNSIRGVLAAALRTTETALKTLSQLLQTGANFIGWTRFRHVEFVARPDDIFIVTYPKSGTTWMQMILYQLATDGNMDFEHIMQVVPWFEQMPGYDSGLESMASPRIFRTHLPYRARFWSGPRGPSKCIYVARNGEDVVVSFYHFYRNYLGYQETFEGFFDRFMRGRVLYGSWFRHVADWKAHEHDPNVLFLTFEELSRDLPGTVQRIAEFCGLPLSDEKLPQIVERSSFAFMKTHEEKFDPAAQILLRNGVHAGTFLRSGRTGEGKQYLDESQRSRYLEAYEKWLGNAGLSW